MSRLDTAMPVVGKDPLPWVTVKFTRSGVLPFPMPPEKPKHKPGVPISRITQRGYERRLRDYVKTATTLSDLVGSMVRGWHDDVVPYRVAFGALPTAGTDVLGKEVLIGLGPVMDPTLTVGQKAAVLTGLVYHEVSHIRYSLGHEAALRTRWPKEHPDMFVARHLANIADDVNGEARLVEDLPGFAPTLPVVMWWVTEQEKEKEAECDLSTVLGRLNVTTSALRYPWTLDWDGTGFRPEGDWWWDWCDRMALVPDDHAAYIALIEEGVERIGHLPPGPTPPPPPPGGGGEGEGEGGEGDGEGMAPPVDDVQVVESTSLEDQSGHTTGGPKDHTLGGCPVDFVYSPDAADLDARVEARRGERKGKVTIYTQKWGGGSHRVTVRQGNVSGLYRDE